MHKRLVGDNRRLGGRLDVAWIVGVGRRGGGRVPGSCKIIWERLA